MKAARKVVAWSWGGSGRGGLAQMLVVPVLIINLLLVTMIWRWQPSSTTIFPPLSLKTTTTTTTTTTTPAIRVGTTTTISREKGSSNTTPCYSLQDLSYSCLDTASAHHRIVPTNKEGGGSIVDLELIDGFANNLFQVAFAIILADRLGYQPRVPDLLGSNHPLFINSSSLDTSSCKEWSSVDQIGDVPCQRFQEAFTHAGREGHCVLVHRGWFQRYSMYQPYKRLIKEVLLPPTSPHHLEGPRPGFNDIVIHIRWESSKDGIDSLQTIEGLHQDLYYPQLSWEYYQMILNRTQPYDRLWIVTMPHLQKSKLVEGLVKVYGGVVISGDRRHDFDFLQRAKRIIMATSTFSWWAAFLSQAWEVHYPLAGFLHPDTHFMPSYDSIIPGEITIYDEPRFIYHDLLAQKWWGRFNTCRNSFDFEL